MDHDPPRHRPVQHAGAESGGDPGARRRHNSRSEGALGAKRAVTNRFVADLYRLQEQRARDPARPKDADAHEALWLASMVFVQLAGWARDHVVGRELKGIPKVAYAKDTKRERELGPVRPWDDEALEKLGAAYRFDDPVANQRIVAALAFELQEMLGGLSFLISDAFQALEKGEVKPLLEPARDYLKGPAHSLWELRFRAVRFVEFRRGLGLLKYQAQDAVATAYDLGDEYSRGGRRTLDGWRERLPQHFDPFQIRDFARGRSRSRRLVHASKERREPQ